MSLTPLNRWETFMAKIAGKDVDISPLNRREHFYEDIAKKSASVPAMEIEDPTDGQTLVYDATDDVWKNAAGSSGGGVLVVNVTVAEDVYTCDKTAGEIIAAFPLVVFLQTGEFGTEAYWVVWYVYDPDYGYHIITLSGTEYTAATENDYPSFEMTGC